MKQLTKGLSIYNESHDLSYESSLAVTFINTKKDANKLSLTNSDKGKGSLFPISKEYLEAVRSTYDTSVSRCCNATADSDTDSFKRSSSADEYSSIFDYDVPHAITASDPCSNYARPVDYPFDRADSEDNEVIICEDLSSYDF